MWHMTWNMWHVTHDTWQVTGDKLEVMNILLKFQLSSSYGFHIKVYVIYKHPARPRPFTAFGMVGCIINKLDGVGPVDNRPSTE